MKQKKLNVLLIISISLGAIGLLLFLFNNKFGFLANGDQISTIITHTSPILAIDNEEPNYFISKPNGLAVDERDNMYIADMQNNCIMVYDSAGYFLKKIGRAGQGPGEFMIPVDVAIAREKLFVLEAENFRVSILDLEGNFIRSFRVEPLTSDQKIAVSKDGNIICLNEPSPKTYSLFTFYDCSGKVVRRFGELFTPEDRTQKSEMNTVCFDFDHNGNLYVFFRYRPEIRKYDMHGRLLFSGNFPIPEAKEKEQDLRNFLKKHPRGGLVTFVSDIVLSDSVNSLFVCAVPPKSKGPFILVYQFDLNLNPLRKIISYPPPEGDLELWFMHDIEILKNKWLIGINQYKAALCKIALIK